MAVKIRLSRLGKKDKPSYRIVAIDSKNKRDGKVLEVLGLYDPTLNPPSVNVDKKRLEYWLGVGAVPSEVIQKLLHL